VLCIDSSSVTAVEGTRWRPFSGVGQAKFSFLGVKLEGRQAGRKIKAEEDEPEFDMVSTISFTLAKLQHSNAASRVFTRTVVVKVI
jgi:hypothetical protein